MRQLQN